MSSGRNRNGRYEQEIEERVEEDLREESGELEAERSDINDKDALKSSWTNVQSTSRAP